MSPHSLRFQIIGGHELLPIVPPSSASAGCLMVRVLGVKEGVAGGADGLVEGRAVVAVTNGAHIAVAAAGRV